tara:strand:+ start:539 stop:676 length:138 start_codon:yes stop_codon:yes gene_type:complete
LKIISQVPKDLISIGDQCIRLGTIESAQELMGKEILVEMAREVAQ